MGWLSSNKAVIISFKIRNKMFNLFEKKTKWIPLVSYNTSGTDYIVFVRKGLKSGMIYFKTKRITPFATCSYNFNITLFDVDEQFDKVLST
jgi:hypothetical protein